MVCVVIGKKNKPKMTSISWFSRFWNWTVHEWNEHFALTESEDENIDDLNDRLPKTMDEEHEPVVLDKPSVVVDPNYKNKLRNRK